jgi:hypothetical protein
MAIIEWQTERSAGFRQTVQIRASIARMSAATDEGSHECEMSRTGARRGAG